MKRLLILSGKGGTGKTTTAAAFAAFSNTRAAADCDVDAPNLHLILQPDPPPQSTTFWGGEKAKIDPTLCTRCGACAQACRFHAITREAEKRAEEIISQAEEECRALKDMASDYCEDTLRRMEEAVADTYDEVKHTCAKFRSALGAASGGSAPRNQPPRRAMYDAEADED